MKRRAFSLGALAVPVVGSAAWAKSYGPGASDSEIRLGQSMPYSGPVSALGVVGKSQAAYFRMLNETQKGINGRKVTLVSLDDGYSPPKTVEMTRQLVESEKVLAIVNTLGTATNRAIHRYLNQRKVPQLFILTGASQWNDPKNHPWTMMGMIAYETEGEVYARHILQSTPNARIALLRQNDDFGKDYAEGFRHALGAKAKDMIVAEVTYETTDPTVDSQVIQLRASNADALFVIATGKHATQAIRKARELGWKAQVYLPVGSSSVVGVLRPAGTDAATGVITAANAKSPGDPAWEDDAGMKEYYAFIKRWAPELNPHDSFAAAGFTYGHLIAHVLRQCGDELTRENVMKQAASLKGYTSPLTLPGITLDTSANDYKPYQKLRLQRFDGTSYRLIGDVIEAG
ncbi:MAG: ABC transporter substrate-binding protein [Alphaproteobacteria bacterium]|nr:ABC transporter substrate-binding protein [Alphaproteobacteria bacterium]MCW5739497.1 ABC transporter substrate-binding protein [Alphaproteobacteria bacterium]